MHSSKLHGRLIDSAAAVLLVIVALTGKLAFLTLSKKELQGTGGAVALLQGRAGGTQLDRELVHLVSERKQLATKYAQVTAAQRERVRVAQEEKALLATEHRELAHLQQVKKEIAHKEETGKKFSEKSYTWGLYIVKILGR